MIERARLQPVEAARALVDRQDVGRETLEQVAQLAHDLLPLGRGHRGIAERPKLDRCRRSRQRRGIGTRLLHGWLEHWWFERWWFERGRFERRRHLHVGLGQRLRRQRLRAVENGKALCRQIEMRIGCKRLLIIAACGIAPAKRLGNLAEAIERIFRLRIARGERGVVIGHRLIEPSQPAIDIGAVVERCGKAPFEIDRGGVIGNRLFGAVQFLQHHAAIEAGARDLAHGQRMQAERIGEIVIRILWAAQCFARQPARHQRLRAFDWGERIGRQDARGRAFDMRGVFLRERCAREKCEDRDGGKRSAHAPLPFDPRVDDNAGTTPQNGECLRKVSPLARSRNRAWRGKHRHRFRAHRRAGLACVR